MTAAEQYARLMEQTMNDQNFDFESFEQFENFSVNPSISMAGQVIKPGYEPVPGAVPRSAYKGELALRVVRSTSNLNAPLPIPFGSAFAFSQNYLQVLRLLVPSGVVVSSVSVSADNNKITIVFASSADAAVTDTVTIFGDTYSLIAFNQGLYSRKAKTTLVRFTTPEVAALYNSVSANPARPFTSTWLSNVVIDRNTISLSPGQFNKNVFDITAPMDLSDEKGFSLYLPADTANASTAYTYTVQPFFEAIGKQ